jgi:hypothetical protein
MINACRIFVRKPEGKRPLGRPRHSWEDNIKMDPKIIGYDMNWIQLVQERESPVASSCEHGNEP